MDIALLAPVPEEHLLSGEVVCANAGKVAFGTRAFDPFGRLRDAGAIGCDVLIYASHSAQGGPPKATWAATYAGYVEAKNGAHPQGMALRPPTTAQYPSDNKGHWFLFWEVTDLRKLSPGESPLLTALRGEKAASNFKPGFIPEGPIVIQAPLD